MQFKMEIEEIEAVLEKIWDLHDKLSDAIHSISRAHYLNSVRSRRKQSDDAAKNSSFNTASTGDGYVFVKDFRADDNNFSSIQEAKSLNAIRCALEHLEDQLEFFHTVQLQQRAERDTAIARLEQSRIVLAMRLAEHQGKKFKVIEEALALVGDVQDASRFVSPDDLYGSAPPCPPPKTLVSHEWKIPRNLIKVLATGFSFAKESLKFDQMGGILGNAALVAISMIALLHLHGEAYKDNYTVSLQRNQEGSVYHRNERKGSVVEVSSSGGRLNELDVKLARG